jgi:hypothetical protein
MAGPRSSVANLVLSVIVVTLGLATIIATICLWAFVDWGRYDWALRLTLRIVWGVWALVFLAALLTRATIFGWAFRRYFRWAGESPPAVPPVIRPTKAPWSKSGKASFLFTVIMTSVTGAIAIAIAVMWVLKDVTGDWVFMLVFKILGISWWVLVVGIVLTRIAIFGWQRGQDLQQQSQPLPAQPQQQQQQQPPQTGDQESRTAS